MSRHRKPRRVQKDVKYLCQQRGGGAGDALSRVVMSGFKGIMKTSKLLQSFKGITPTPAVTANIGKIMHIIKQPVREARKLFPFRPDIPPGAKREWAKYVTKQFYAPHAANMVGQAVGENIPVWQRVFQKPLVP